jgi:hypothetical protein
MRHFIILSPLFLICLAVMAFEIPEITSNRPMIFDMKGEWLAVEDPFVSRLDQRPTAPLTESWKDPNAILFVSIAHYRDPRCATTIKNLYSKAKHPHRLRFGKF